VSALVTRLRLTDFRNHRDLSIGIAAAMVVIVGDNGSGKTNILEALSLFTAGRGLRRATLGDMARRDGGGGFALSLTLGDEEIRLGTGLIAGEHNRSIRINGVAEKSAESFADYLRVLWLTPAMDGLFTGAAGERRRFLDRAVLAIDPSHGRRVAAYETALTQRNRLLEDIRSDSAWLDAIEAQIAELGTALAAARRETLACLTRLGETTDASGPFPVADLALADDIGAALETASAADVEDWFRQDLKAGRSRDRAARRTLVGPHRAELQVTHRAKEMPAALSSTGEQKALLIGLTLAKARLVRELTGMSPLLLLDEVAAHLDAGRRSALFHLLAEVGGQSVMTGTDAVAFADLGERADFFVLPPGELSAKAEKIIP
jgi:DNA replication and repair protein RecF